MKISRTGIENFNRCKRCFWLDAVKKIKPPFGPPFTLNLSVDYSLTYIANCQQLVISP